MTMDFWDAAALSTSVAAADRSEGVPENVSNSTPSIESVSAASPAASDAPQARTESMPATTAPPLPATDPWDLAVLGVAVGSEQAAAVPSARQDEPAVGRLIDVSLQGSALSVDTSAPVEILESLPPLSADGEAADDDDDDDDGTDGGVPLVRADAVVVTAVPVLDDSDDLPVTPVLSVAAALLAESTSENDGLVDMALGDATGPPFAAVPPHSPLLPKAAPADTSLSAAVATADLTATARPLEQFRQAPELTSKDARQKVRFAVEPL